MNVGWEHDDRAGQGERVIYDEDLRHTCGGCGARLQIVRPGKYQCPNSCERTVRMGYGWEHDDRSGHFEKQTTATSAAWHVKEVSEMKVNEIITRIFGNGAVWAAIIALLNAIQRAYFPNVPQEIVVAANMLVVAVLGAAGVYLAGQKDGYVKAMNVTNGQGARLALIVGLLIVVGALLLANAPVANAESPTADRLAQEPALYCVALEVGLPADAVALAKVKFDTKYGAANQIVTADQWAATWGDRMQYYVDWLGVANPTRDGVPLKWCARLIAAQARILEP